MIDVDGSYLYRKHKQLADTGYRPSPLDVPAPPPTGWVMVTADNHREIATKIPAVSAGKKAEQ